MTPAEDMMPVNDIEVMTQPLVINHSENVSEMLIIDEESRPFFSSSTKEAISKNPFHQTKYPRIMSHFDVLNCKGSQNLDSLVDITCWFNSVDSNTNQQVLIPISGSGFLVAPPNKLNNLEDCWEFFFFTALHNNFPMMQNDKNLNKDFRFSPSCVKATLGNRHRASHTSNSVECSIVTSSGFNENCSETLEHPPDKDWILMKVKMEYMTDQDDLEYDYLIPSPSKAVSGADSDYDMCILACPGVPTERDVKTLSEKVDFDTDILTLRTYFEIDCKHISFGKLMDSSDSQCLHYNASSFPGSSGGAILPCSESFTPWQQFKKDVTVNRSVIGIHVGSEKTNNRGCHVNNWFNAFYEYVFLPMRSNFTLEEIEIIEKEKIYMDKNSISGNNTTTI